GIVGPTGSGKSVLLQVLAGGSEPDHGEVRVGGIPLRELAPSARPSAVQLVPAVPVLFAGTVADNLRLGQPGADERTLWAALEQAGADGFVRALPDGLESVLGSDASTLSGGQRQRLALARALVCDPAVLLLDDVTAALDAVTEQLILPRLLALPATTVIVSHRETTLAALDGVALLDDGRVVACAPHRQLLAEVAAYRELITAPVGRP
ncbi:MAG: ATP-binding cassette domain-containing protein, partial [Nitriliruptoraceae bacterium]